jgi:exonuclease III
MIRFRSLVLISWNVANRKNSDEQIEALEKEKPDIVALQESTESRLPALERALRGLGLRHLRCRFGPQNCGTKARCYGQLIASRWPIRFCLPRLVEPSWPERLLSVKIDSPWGSIQVHSAYVPPGSSNGWSKIDVLRGIYTLLRRRSRLPRILCGDFNTPQAERPNGEIVTWGQDIGRDGKAKCWRSYRGGTGEVWDQAERNVLSRLSKFDLRDVFRSLHCYCVEDFSWYLKRKETRIGRRFDHVFASKVLNAVECSYMHCLRERNLSDHSAIKVRFSPTAAWTAALNKS